MAMINVIKVTKSNGELDELRKKEIELVKEFKSLEHWIEFQVYPIKACKNDAEGDMRRVQLGSCKYCSMFRECGESSLRCNRFYQFYDRNKLIYDKKNDLFTINPKYQESIERRIRELSNTIEHYYELL